MKFLYQFSAGDSFMHRLDPRTKLMLVVCFLIATFIIPHPWIMPLLIIGILWVGANVKPTEYYLFLVLMLPLMIGVTLVHLLTRPGPYFFTAFGFLHLSIPGLESGLTIAFRLAAMGIAFMMFSMTTDPFDWGLSMYKSGLPYRIAFMFAFAMRIFPLIQEELNVIRNALAARAYDAVGTSNPAVILRGAIISAFPLIVGSLRRSQDIAMSMEMRGLSAAEELGVQRTLYRDIQLRRQDYVVMAGALLFVAASILYGAYAGTLPLLGRTQLIFGLILIGGLLIVAWRIGKVVAAG